MRSTAVFFAAFSVFMLLSSCHSHLKKGNGRVVTVNRPAGNFDHIVIDGVFPVELSQNGDSAWVKVETDENLQKNVKVSTDDGKLEISNTEGDLLNGSTKMKIYINVKNLRGLDFKSVGELTTKGMLKVDSLDVNSESVGKLNLDITADFLHANLNSVGNTTFSGQVREVRINNKSMGALSAFDLKAGTLMIHNTSVGVTQVYADSAFYIRSSSVGALYYKGPGVVKELKSEGIGVVQKKE